MNKIIVKRTLSIQNALEIINQSPIKTLLVVDQNDKLYGSLTDGDVRRWILKTGDIEGTVADACNRSPTAIQQPYDIKGVQAQMKKKHIQAVPVIDRDRRIETVVLSKESTGTPDFYSKAFVNTPILIMAGGKGTRLDPFTRILPKPLLPIGSQPVIELIINELAAFGADKFYLSLNHQARLIKAYFEEVQYPFSISFIEEEQPLGTAGSLKLMADNVAKDVLVTNCDVIIKTNYGELLDYHNKKENAITIVVSTHNVKVPYGVCEVNEEGILKKIIEKPEYNMLINTGMYVVSSRCIPLIPSNKVFHFTNLIEAAINKGVKVGVFPIPETAYHDVGQWDAYHSAINKLTSKEVY